MREILTPEQRADAATVAAMDEAPDPPRQTRLNWSTWSSTVLTIGVGICLLLGFFTRLASVAGAVFLLAVIATQPPWVADATPTIYQTVELAGLLVLAGTGAGRWLGLDFFTYALFSRSDPINHETRRAQRTKNAITVQNEKWKVIFIAF